MRLPFKVSTTTSNFMIGVTAAASAGVYLQPRLHRPGPRHAGDARRAARLAAGAQVAGARARAARCASSSPSLIVALGVADDLRRLTGGHADERRAGGATSRSKQRSATCCASASARRRRRRARRRDLPRATRQPRRPTIASSAASRPTCAASAASSRRAADWRGRGIIQLGLLVLLATPVARVAFSVVAFALQRDRLYVAVTLVVLAVLLYSIVGAER